MRREKANPNFFLHCDECHHEVVFDGWMGRQHIGFPCPLCRSDMLTESDYKVGRRIQWVLRFLRFLGFVRRDEGAIRPNEERVRWHYHNGRFTQTKLDG